MIDRTALRAVALREIRTVLRTRAYLLLAIGLAVVLFGIVDRSDAVAAGYVPSTVDLLLPMELLVPLVAVAIGYRAFTGDNDDSSVLSTYPISTPTLVTGVFVGRLVGLAAILALPLVAVLVSVAWTPTVGSTVFATTDGVDSPILFVRFIVLTVFFGAVVLAMTLAVSVLTQSSKAALALGIGVFVAVVAGGDLLLIGGLATGSIDDGMLRWAIGVSPNSAYRGLVYELVIGVATAEQGYADVGTSVIGLGLWSLLGLLVTALGIKSKRRAAIAPSIKRHVR